MEPRWKNKAFAEHPAALRTCHHGFGKSYRPPIPSLLRVRPHPRRFPVGYIRSVGPRAARTLHIRKGLYWDASYRFDSKAQNPSGPSPAPAGMTDYLAYNVVAHTRRPQLLGSIFHPMLLS